jgi:hypothetical protein
MAEKAELASKEAGEQSNDSLFQRVAKILRLSKAWVDAKRRAAAEGTAGSSSILNSSTVVDDNMTDLSQTDWMQAFESGDQTWFEEYFGWSPGTL